MSFIIKYVISILVCLHNKSIMIFGNSFNNSNLCSFDTPNSILNLVLAILYSLTGSIVLITNTACLAFYLKYKKKNDWKWNDVDLLLIFLCDIICGCLSYLTAIAYCVDLNELHPISCIAKYCCMFFICTILASLIFINGCERLFSIKFNTHNMKRFQQKHSKLISFLKPSCRIG